MKFTLFRKLKALKNAVSDFLQEFIEEFPEFLDGLAEGYRTGESRDEYTRVERLLKGFVQKDKILFGKKSVYRVHSLWSLAEFYRSHYRYGEAEKLYMNACGLLFASLEEEKRLPFEFREKLTRLINFLGDYNKNIEAEHLLRRLMEETREFAGKKEKAHDHALAALLSARNGKEKEAGHHLQLARNLQEELLGPDSAELIEFLEAQKFVFSRIGVSAEFLADCRKHLELLDPVVISDRALGKDHQFSVSALQALETYYRLQGKDELAERISLRKEIAFLAHKVKGEYRGLVRDLRKLAELYERRKEGADATMAFHALKRAILLEKSAGKTR